MPRARFAVVVLVAALAVGGAAAPAAEARLRRCKAVTVQGEKVPVSAQRISCRRARRLVRGFVARRRLPANWTSDNPAGCEHLLFRRKDRRKVRRAGPLPQRVTVIGTVDTFRCSS